MIVILPSFYLGGAYLTKKKTCGSMSKIKEETTMTIPTFEV